MRGTRNNCLGSRKHNMTFCQAETDKHECLNTALLLHCCTLTYLFRPDEEYVSFYLTRNNCCEFLACNGVILQSDLQYAGKEDCSASDSKKNARIFFTASLHCFLKKSCFISEKLIFSILHHVLHIFTQKSS